MSVAVSPYNAPTFLELVPEELDLRVFRHTVETAAGPVSCWSYVTDGLRRLGQKDIVFTLRRQQDEADDDYPRDPLDYFLLIHRMATEGKTVEAGGYSRFARPDGFLGRDGPVGMTFVNAVPLRGVNYPDRPLAAFLITAEEVEAIRAHGTYRLLSLLGFRANYFPYPPWSERARPQVLSLRDYSSSLLGQLPLASVRGLMTLRQRNQVHLHLADDDAIEQLAIRLDEIQTNAPFVLLTDPDPDAKARLVWKPSMPVETIAIDNRPEATLTGGFVAFFVARGADEGVHVCEDGFAVNIRPKTFAKVCDALFAGESFTVRGSGSSMNLVCGISYDAPAVRQTGSQYFQNDEVRWQRITSEDLSWFDRRVGHVIEDHFSDLPANEGEALSVFCIIRPGQLAKFWIECQPIDLVNGSRSLLLRRLAALKPPIVTDSVAWSMQYELWGGSGDPSDFTQMPVEWTTAIAPEEKPQIPDQILERVWPSDE